jgi:hypothetical protein
VVVVTGGVVVVVVGGVVVVVVGGVVVGGVVVVVVGGVVVGGVVVVVAAQVGVLIGLCIISVLVPGNLTDTFSGALVLYFSGISHRKPKLWKELLP